MSGGVASYKTLVKKSGVSTTFTLDAFTVVAGSSNKKYQINNLAKRIWDRDAAFSFFDNAVPIVAGQIESIDYLFGIVTFTVAKTGPITATGKYMPTTYIGGANNYTLELGGEILDNTSFEDSLGADAGYRTKKYGLLDVSASIGRFDDLAKDFKTILASRNPIVLEFNPGGLGELARGWFLLTNTANDGELSALENEALTFSLDGEASSGFSWPTS